MNLEEELSILTDNTTTTTTVVDTPAQMPVSNGQVQAQAQVVQPTQTMVQPTQTMVQPVVQPTQPINQPAMVNPSAAQNMVSQFDIPSLDFDINKREILERNPIEKLVGEKDKKFRLHMLPGVQPQEVKVHWDAEKGHNFACLGLVYNKGTGKCCATHGNAKQRFVIPVIEYPAIQLDPNTPVMGQLKALVVSGKTLQEIKDQTMTIGTTIEQSDLVATVKDPKYKTFTFAVNPTPAINLISNLENLKAEWSKNATPQNIIKLCGRLITEEEYDAGYSSYDYNKYKPNYNTPTQAQVPNNVTPQNFMNPQAFATNVQPGYQQYGTQAPEQTPQQNVVFDANTNIGW